MVRIRLSRVGLKKQPSYRIVVADRESPRDGRHIEIIGHFNPRTEPNTLTLDEGRALYWLSVGAQPSQAVERLLKNLGTLDLLARLRKGETLEALTAEAQAAQAARGAVSPKTRHTPPAPGAGAGKKTAAQS
jgi:small subunit ribosomal protein S16